MVQTMVELRRKLDITQEELAANIGVSKGAIGMYETGKRTPSLNRAKQIAQFFGITLEDLVFSQRDT